ncbi:MAG: dodecin [Actinomycetes bacterium]|jgi:hypothetical protein
MTSRTYALTEIVGTSPVSVDDAIKSGIKRAAESTRHIDWFEVTEIRGNLRDGELTFIQVGMKLGYRLEDA